jgi:FkbM family methyltransferase
MSAHGFAWQVYKSIITNARRSWIIGQVARRIRMLSRLDEMIRRAVVRTVENPLHTQDLVIHFERSSRDYHYILDLVSGSYEKDTRAILGSLLSPGMTVVDAGAHIGYFSLLAARHVRPGGKVYSFEPHPLVFALLKRNLVANHCEDIVQPINKAVWNTVGSATFYLDNTHSAASSLYPRPDADAPKVTIDIETISLDEFFRRRAWPAVDLVKLDVEGAERVALDGMREVASRNPSLKLIMEFNPATLMAAQVKSEDLFGTLGSMGFGKIYTIVNGLQPCTMPQDIPRLDRIAAIHGTVNLLCDR